MSASGTRTLIVDGVTSFGTEMLIVLGAVIVVIVGFYVFRRGIQWLKKSK